MVNLISKKELVQRIATDLKKISLTQKQIENVLDSFLKQTKKALIKGEKIRLVGYFSFITYLTKPRMARNLQTGKMIKVPAKRTPKVKFSKVLKEEMTKK